MTITPKPQNQKTKKTKLWKKLFGLASKDVFFVFLVVVVVFLFFWFWNAKTKKTLCFFGLRKSPNLGVETKKQKNTRNTKKNNLLRPNQKVSSKFFLFFYWDVFWLYFCVFVWFSLLLHIFDVVLCREYCWCILCLGSFFGFHGEPTLIGQCIDQVFFETEIRFC